MSDIKPKKQGLIYCLDLGQNDGPYLLKDIMLNNPKSLYFIKKNELNSISRPITSKILLKSDNILPSQKFESPKSNKSNLQEPEKVEIELINFSNENIEEKYRSKLENTDNFLSEIAFHEKTLDSLIKDVKLSKENILELKKSIKELRKTIDDMNSTSLKKELISTIRSFFSNSVKSLMQAELDEYFKLKKKTDQLIKEKNILQLNVDWAEKKIISNEKFLGVDLNRLNWKSKKNLV